LKNIIINVQNDIQKKAFKTAYNRINMKLIPRIDGCNGGQSERRLHHQLRYSVADVRKLEEHRRHYQQLCEKTLKPKDMTAFKNDLINSLQENIDNLDNLSDDDINGPTGDPKGFLLDAVTIAINYALDGDSSSTNYVDLKNEMMTSFIPYVDGLNNNDLIVNATSRASVYNSAMAIINEITLVSITIAPASVTVKSGASQQFAAMCAYANKKKR